jgi:hypothetical protein
VLLQPFIPWRRATKRSRGAVDLVFGLRLVVAPFGLGIFDLGFMGADSVVAIGLGRLGSLGHGKRRQQGGC